jgi:hypothetical protein
MGFEKRFITRDSIISKKDIDSIFQLLEADSIIYDNWSSNFFENIDKNWLNYQIKRDSIIEENKLSSYIPDVSDIKDTPLSLIYFNLFNNPNWVDIELCLSNFRPIDIPVNIQGKFEDLCKFCISLIENRYNNEAY